MLVKQWAVWEAAKTAAVASQDFAAAKAAKKEMDEVEAWAAGVAADGPAAQLLAKLQARGGPEG